MSTHEAPVYALFADAEKHWDTYPGLMSLRDTIRTNVSRLRSEVHKHPELLVGRARNVDQAVQLFNRTRRNNLLVENEAITLAHHLPADFELPTIGQLARHTRQRDSFFTMMLHRISRGDYPFTEAVGEPGPLLSITLLAGYSLSIQRLLASRRFAAGVHFDNMIISGLSTMMNPKSVLYRDIFRAPQAG